MPQRESAFLYIFTEMLPRVLSKIYAIKVLTNIIEIKKDKAYATGANGSSLAAVAIIVKHEIVLAIIGGLFVLETVSVIIQVISFKLTGKRVFMMAPIHHHFEKKGWAESAIVIRFWIIAIILALIGLATLKLR